MSSTPLTYGNHLIQSPRIRRDTELSICNKKNLNMLRRNSNWQATEEYLTSLRQSCTTKYNNKSCDEGIFPSDSPSLTVRRNESNKQEYVQINMYNVTNYTDCWLFAFIAKSPKETKIDFNEFYGDTVKIKFYYKPGFVYSFQIIALPTGQAKVFDKWPAPGRCEMEVMYDIQTKDNYNVCSKKNLFHEDLMDQAKNLCDGKLETYERRAKVRNELRIIDCKLIYINRSRSLTGQELLKKNAISEEVEQVVIASVIGLLVVTALLVLLFYCKRRKKYKFNQDWITEFEELNNDGPPSVMVVHRPGCERLDQFIQQFSSLLMSYNLQVKTTFDGCDLSAEGGIASYMQRNIQICDNILILITEKTGEKVPLKHRPFEFSLKLMEGIAIHEPSTGAQFIPVYLSSYHKAVKMFPPFLKANTSYGYSIPSQIDDLIYKLFGVKKQDLKKSEDRIVKDKLFQEEMRESSQAFLSSKHKECNIEHCQKGVKHISHTNLSSIWATTINTKWKSTETLDEEFRDNEAIFDEMKNLQYFKALQFVENMSDSIDELPKEFDKIPDAIYREKYDITNLMTDKAGMESNIKFDEKHNDSANSMDDLLKENSKVCDVTNDSYFDVKYMKKKMKISCGNIINIEGSIEDGINLDIISDVISEERIDVKNGVRITDNNKQKVLSETDNKFGVIQNDQYDDEFDVNNKYIDAYDKQSLLCDARDYDNITEESLA